MTTKKTAISTFWIPIFICLVALQCTKQSKNVPTQQVPFEKDYATYSTVLNKFVVDEFVNYRALKQERGPLDNFVNQLGTISKSDLDQLNKAEQMAFWINAYNGLTLRSVIDAYPVSSIKDIDGVWDSNQWIVAGQSVTLDQIEHKILRPVFKDARIHFAVNCASIGCPPLMNEPFQPDLLDQQLDQMTRRFVNNPERNVIDPANKLIRTSELFTWFGSDFITEQESDEEAAIVSFILNYVDSTTIIELDPELDWSLEYDAYDWNLNEVK